MRWFILFCLLSVCVACSPHIEKEKKEGPQDRVISRDEAIGGIPCFKCHSYKKFASVEKGTFPHLVHTDKGYHCNQCHTIKGHRHMKTTSALCKDCHGLKPFTYASGGFPAMFSHESHVSLKCKECHTTIFQMKKGASKITMDAIYQGRFCGACHNGKKAFPSSECGLCHDMKGFKKSIVYKLDTFRSASFNHGTHTQMFTCDSCHPSLFEMKRTSKKMTMNAMNAGKFCGACHNGEKASALQECKKCHK